MNINPAGRGAFASPLRAGRSGSHSAAGGRGGGLAGVAGDSGASGNAVHLMYWVSAKLLIGIWSFPGPRLLARRSVRERQARFGQAPVNLRLNRPTFEWPTRPERTHW